LGVLTDGVQAMEVLAVGDLVLAMEVVAVLLGE
jgi:hypothetical protein